VITFIYDCIKLIQVIYNYWDSPQYMGLVCGLIGCHMGIASYLIVIVYSFRLDNIQWICLLNSPNKRYYWIEDS
jgi:hypothetical protein